MRLDDLWRTGYWDNAGIAPGDPCEACGRRASIHVYGGADPDLGAVYDYMEDHPVHVCGWCHLGGPMLNEADVERNSPWLGRTLWPGGGAGQPCGPDQNVPLRIVVRRWSPNSIGGARRYRPGVPGRAGGVRRRCAAPRRQRECGLS